MFFLFVTWLLCALPSDRLGICSKDRMVKLGLMTRPKLWVHNNLLARDDAKTKEERFQIFEEEGYRNAQIEVAKLQESQEYKDYMDKKARQQSWKWWRKVRHVVAIVVLIGIIASICIASGAIDGYTV